jgi:hypothetical protein
MTENKRKDVFFKQTYFSTRLEKRSQIDKKPKTYISGFFLRPLPVAVFLVIIILSTLIYRQLTSPSTYKKGIESLAQIMMKTTNMESLSLTRESQALKLSPIEKGFAHLEWSIQRVLYGLHRESITDEQIPIIIFKVLQKRKTKDLDKVNFYELEEPAFFPYEKEIQKLRHNNNYNMLFSQIIKKLQEV